MGVDNDDLLCELSRPALSSVALPAKRIGFEAARLLDRLLTQPSSGTERRFVLLAPVGVVTRRSSDVLAMDDVEVAAAIRYIREHAHEPIQVKDVLAEVPALPHLGTTAPGRAGRGVWEEIRRVHMERAKLLLADTDMSMSEVGRHAGFSDARQLSVVFRQENGLDSHWVPAPVPARLLRLEGPNVAISKQISAIWNRQHSPVMIESIGTLGRGIGLKITSRFEG